jgi:predicted AlkP superfamily pyrophosphatase or phosphodiesterase
MFGRKLTTKDLTPFFAVLLMFATAASAAEKPSLVVVISVDQLRSDYLERFRPFFGPEGFRRFLERGAVYPEARWRHANTFTGPGHASLGTGLDPRKHGIVGNAWYDLVRDHAVYCAEDRGASWIGPPPDAPRIPIKPASPENLSAATVGDRLKERYPGARVVGLALKDRSAVLMAGRKADAVLWFEERFARFVTSSYYPPRPSLLAINDRLPAFLDSHRVWELSGKIPPAAMERLTFDPPELYKFKSQPEGVSPGFPHRLPTARAVVSSPYGDELMLELTRNVVGELSLGKNPSGAPDLLFLGLSSTDYYGHWFGPDSKEIAEGIVRLDASLGEFFRWLDDRVGKGRSLVFLSADHGVQPIPQVARAKHAARTGKDDPSIAGRVNLENGPGDAATVASGSPDRVRLEAFLAKKFGFELKDGAANATEGAILYFEEPALYLNRRVLRRRGLDVERVKSEVRAWVAGLPGVSAAFTNTQLADGEASRTPLGVAVERSFRPDRSGDVLVTLKPGWMWSYGRDAGTTHGQFVDDDRRVPVAAWGTGVEPGVYPVEVTPLSIAKTIGAIFGFEIGEPDALVLEAVRGREGVPAYAAAAGR